MIRSINGSSSKGSWGRTEETARYRIKQTVCHNSKELSVTKDLTTAAPRTSRRVQGLRGACLLLRLSRRGFQALIAAEALSIACSHASMPQRVSRQRLPYPYVEGTVALGLETIAPSLPRRTI
jgi:hypothetical protein